MTTDGWPLPAEKVAAAFAAGELSAAECVERALSRFEETEPRVGALIGRLDAEARRRATELDAARARGERPGPLAAVPFVYKDHGSLVALSRYSTVGSLMGNLIGGRMAIEGRLARFVYVSLYRMHLIAIHGWLKGLAMIAVGHVNGIIRPRLKLH